MTAAETLWSLGVALLLAGVFALGRRVSAAENRLGRLWVSIAAGASVAYVFVELLPELATRQRSFASAAGVGVLFAERRIYLVALLGFVVFYGLEHLALGSAARKLMSEAARLVDPRYVLRLGGYAISSALTGYLLIEHVSPGIRLLLFATAMAFHFLVIDHSLRHDHAAAYDRHGRWLLAASVLAGWLVGFSTHLPEVLIARLFAFVGGAVIITGTAAEMPGERQGRFGPFLLGAVIYAVLILLGKGGAE